jgi:Kelch motif
MSEYDPESSHSSRRRAERNAGRGARVAGRLLGVGLFLGGILAIFVVIALSLHVKLPFGINSTATTSSDTGGATGPTGVTGVTHRKPPLTVSLSTVAALLVPASRVAAAPFGTGGALFLGGYDTSGAPTDTVQTLAGASVQAAGTLPAGDASAVAAALGSTVYLFGGVGGIGATIYDISPTASTAVGSLPAPTADAAIATAGGTAYVIGGYTGTTELNTIVAFTPPGTATVVATLPVPLRFATAVATGGEIYVIGGESNGVATKTVYRFDPQTKTVTSFASLPHARDREAAGTLRGRIIVAGGLSTANGQRTRAVYAINVHTAAVHLAGLLPVGLSDITAVQESAGEILMAGGVDASAAASASIYGVTVKHR